MSFLGMQSFGAGAGDYKNRLGALREARMRIVSCCVFPGQMADVAVNTGSRMRMLLTTFHFVSKAKNLCWTRGLLLAFK